MEQAWQLWGDANRHKWPFAPNDWLFLSDATERLWSAAYGDKWRATVQPWDQLPSEVFHVSPTDWLHRLFADRILWTGIKHVSGEIVPIKATHWNCESEVARERIRYCMIADEWIFIYQPNVETVLQAFAANCNLPFAQAALLSDRTGGQGRPSSIHIVEAMMRERAERGELLSSLHAEARKLAQLFVEREDCQEMTRPTPKTIENQLRVQYKILR
jgi:hypothetical protein